MYVQTDIQTNKSTKRQETDRRKNRQTDVCIPKNNDTQIRIMLNNLLKMCKSTRSLLKLLISKETDICTYCTEHGTELLSIYEEKSMKCVDPTLKYIRIAQ